MKTVPLFHTKTNLPLAIALVVPGYEQGGGLPAVADFLTVALEQTKQFRAHIVSPTMGWNDPLNSCVTRPRSWVRGPKSSETNLRGRRVTRVGAYWAEAEVMRYWPRKVLYSAVADSDLVQVVCGSAASAFALRHIRQPLFIQVATTLRSERERGTRSGLRRIVGWVMTRLCEPLEKAALRRADGVFVENRWMFDRLIATLPRERVHFAPPGVDTDFFRPDPAVDRDRLLFVGRLGDPRKNIRLLLEAYKRIRSQVPDAPPLVLAGSSSLPNSEAEFIINNGLASHVEIHTSPDRSTLAVLYRRCRVFMLASHEEGFGIVLVEAMASGAPVVSTDCGGPRTIVDDHLNGYLVPRGDVKALAERVMGLLKDEQRRSAMAQAARARAETAFGLEACGSRFAEVYRAHSSAPKLEVDDAHSD